MAITNQCGGFSQTNPSGGTGGLSFDGGISIGDICKRTGASTIGKVTGIPASLLVSAQILATFTHSDTPEYSAFGYHEKGEEVTDVAMAWTFNRNADDPTSQELDNSIGDVDVSDRGYTHSGQSITSNRTYNLSAVGDDGTVSAAALSVAFVYPTYHGVGAAGLTGAQVAGLTKRITTPATVTLAFSPTDQVYYFAYPATAGDLVSVIDGNGFNVTQDFTLRNPVSITGLDGTPQNYKVYEFKNLTSISQNLTFNF